MFWTIARFEFGFQLRQIITPITFGIFFLLTFSATTVEQVSIGSTGNVNINSPFAISQVVIIMSLFGMFIPVAVLANAVMRDQELKTNEMFFTLPIRPWQYILGRFIGAFAVALIIFSSVPLGVMLGSFMPWLDPDRIGPFVPWHYVYALFVIGAPNLLVSGLVCFTVANWTRSTVATYTSLVVFIVAYFVGLNLAQEPEMIARLAPWDPIGFLPLAEVTRYWTAFESNERLVPLDSVYGLNRAIWVCVGLALLAINVATFSFRRGKMSGSKKKKGGEETRFVPHTISLPRVSPVFNGGTVWTQFAARTGFEVRSVVTTITFWVLLVLGIFNTLGALLNFDLLYGVPAHPVTRVMMEQIYGTFSLVPYVVAIYYAADIIWREQQVKINEIIDATPAPNAVFVLSKFLALALVIIALLGVAVLTGVAVQLAQGFTDIDFGMYVWRLIIVFGTSFVLLGILSMFVQILSLNRFVGMLLMVLVLIGQITLSNIGWEHNLYQFGTTPATPLSDMNGDGHYIIAWTWFTLYWTFFCGILIVLSYLLWMRGNPGGFLTRLRGMGAAFGRVSAALLAVFLTGWIGTGAYIYYNTNILNEYVTTPDQEKLALAYEDAYLQYEHIEQPHLVAVTSEVDIYPDELRLESRGTYQLVNPHDTPIERVHYDLAFPLEVNTLTLDGATLETEDTDLNYFIFALDEPMQPGEERTLTFDVVWDYDGFRNSNNGTRIVYNGTFVDSGEIAPSPGFNRQKMLIDRNTRRRYDREPVDRAPKLEQEEFHSVNVFSRYGAWTPFETTVSTKEGQTAIAPGYLERDWIEDGRHYFHYKMDEPILPFMSYLSADYAVRRDQWKDVALEVYYHPEHEYNIDRMIEAMQKSFDYFTEAFSPYQFRQMRILEFPDYATFAQSFANTVPYSEGIGFIADIRDIEDIDFVYFVTAHELAHQWWAHQVLAANVQGSAMIHETLSQYSAMMVMEREYGEHQIRKFLKYELDRYLSARGSEQIEELPLYRVENQGYIHYRKGAVAMYALKDYVGEETVNRTLRRLIELRAFKTDQYATTLDFLRLLREQAGPEHDELIRDLFERIVIWDLKVTDSAVAERDDGRFDVTLTIEASKAEYDGEGRETPLDLAMPIDIGLFTEHPDDVHEGDAHVILLEKRPIVTGEQTITVTVDERPAVVGVDPYNKLIDRNSDDNLSAI